MAEIRFRVRGPDWTDTITAKEDWTIGQLLDYIKEKRGVDGFQLKYGWPPKVMDTVNLDATFGALNLKGETMTLVPAESADATAAPAPAAPAAPEPEKPAFKPKPVEPDETVVDWPEKSGYLGEFSPRACCHLRRS